MTKYKPGETCSESGHYAVYKENGERIGEIYLEKEETFPPTQYQGSYYEKA